MPELNDPAACVMITGGNGMIGSHTVAHFHANGIRTVSVDRAPRANDVALLDVDVPTALVDLLDLDALDEICARERVSHIVHLAYPGALDQQVGCMRNVLEVAARHGVERVVYASSGAVYGPIIKPGGALITEREPVQIHPAYLYRSAKIVGEWMGALYEREHGRSFVGLRVSTVYGPGMSARGWGREIRQALRGEPTRISFLRGPLDDPIYVVDVARAALAACVANGPLGPAYNIAGKGLYSNEDLAAAIRGACPGAQIEATDAFTEERMRIPLDISLAATELAWSPEYDLERGIGETVEWFATIANERRR